MLCEGTTFDLEKELMEESRSRIEPKYLIDVFYAPKKHKVICLGNVRAVFGDVTRTKGGVF